MAYRPVSCNNYSNIVIIIIAINNILLSDVIMMNIIICKKNVIDVKLLVPSLLTRLEKAAARAVSHRLTSSR